MLERYERQICLEELGAKGQEKLLKSSALIIGMGGLGCPAAQYLVAAGLGKIGLVDADVVSLNNLQRQVLYSEKDIGQKKVEVASAKLSQLNSKTKLESYPLFVDTSNVLKLISNYAVIIDATDSFYSKYLLNDACYQLQKPLVLASILRFSGQIGVFCGPHTKPAEAPNFREVFPEPPSQAPTCSEAGILGPVCGVIGSLQATEAIKVLLDKKSLAGRLLVIDLLDYKFSSLEIERTSPEISSLQNEEFYQQYKTNNCPMSEKINGIKQLSAKELSEIDKSEIQVLDVREDFERDICEIGGSHIPLGELQDRANELDKNKKLIVYCKMGGRSQRACEFLAEQGFKEVENLSGGILGYQSDVDQSLERY